MSVNGVEIQVGQVWKTRNGERVVIDGNSGHTVFPWCSRNGSYGDNGRFTHAGKNAEDLIELVSSPAQPAIAVGQVWQTRNGERVTIQRNDNHATFPWVAGMQSYSDIGEAYGPRKDMALLFLVEESAPTIAAPAPRTVFDEQIIDMHVVGYHTLANVLQLAYNQAAVGKGAERHANSLPFHEQPMTTINRALGTIDGFIYQAHKKSLEAKRLPTVDRQIAELLGAINYLAGAVIALELGRGDK